MSIEDTDLWVAQRLKDMRGERGITLTTLAEQTGISSAHLSRLEKGVRKPSIGSLLQIARVYGVSISELVQEPDQDDFHLVRADAAMTRDGQDGRYTVLSGSRETMSVVRVELAAGKNTKTARHVGEEWLHVLSGAITLDISGVSLELDTGDSVHFDSSKEHRLTNKDDVVATVLIASTAATVPMRHPIPASSRRGSADSR
ncbi:helix-turn-helix domain-containing protein [Streptomyces prunicolor]|uniref:helix-turn-helix domain-containing protein n=1 Tax=Streptomyces prunicolor TaxID=67348 RepID=UPI00342FF449